MMRPITCLVIAMCLAFAAPVGAQSPSLEDLQSAATAADPDAQFALGMRYHQGDGVLQSYARAAEWFEAAAAQGHPPAQNFLGKYLFEGLNGASDRARALVLLRQAAQSGEPQFLYDAALVLALVDETLPEAVAYYQAAADAGHVDAGVSLGALYQEGVGVPQDFAKARELYLPAAQQGHPRALNNLGLLYVRGNGVPQDYARAAEYFAAAAERGLPRAYRNLGVLYESGQGVPLDEAKAAELYRLAGRGGADQNELAQEPTTFVYDGRLIPLNVDTIDVDALVTAAEGGDPIALFQMGWLEISSTPEPIDFATYRRVSAAFRAAAERGHGPSMINLGILYFEGWGLPQDYALGQMWLLLAANSQPEAKRLQARFASRLSKGQVAEAQKLAQEKINRWSAQLLLEE